MGKLKKRTTVIPKKVDYQQILRDISKSMVRLRKPERLLRMITRTIDRQMGVSHTSLVIYQQKKGHYIFVDSKGSKRIPVSLVKFDADHSLIDWFSRRNGHKTEDYLYRPNLSRAGGKSSANGHPEKIERTARAMDNLKTELAVPGYFKRDLLGILLLGKKLNGRCFTDDEISFFQILVQDCSMAVKTAEYHQSLLDRNDELEIHLKEIERLRKKEHETFYEVLRSLAQEVYAKDAYTFGHVRQVERLGLMAAKELKLDLSGRNKDLLSAGLILHDVGKIGIPDHILNKPARLDPEEWEIMKTHVEKGANILEHMSDFKPVAEIVRCHHENYDGSGYPRGLTAENIPIESRIVSVVDAFHAIVSTRCYSKGRPIEVAFQELRRCAGTQFDPDVVEALIRGIKKDMKKRGVAYIHEELESGAHPNDLKNTA